MAQGHALRVRVETRLDARSFVQEHTHGLHVSVPLAGKDDWGSVKSFAAALAHEMVEATPGLAPGVHSG